MTEPDILDFDTHVKKVGPLRQRGNILYFAPRDDYPSSVIHKAPYIERTCFVPYLYGLHTTDGVCRMQPDLDTAVTALYMAYLNHCNRDLEITE